jgi:hypothetical protein
MRRSVQIALGALAVCGWTLPAQSQPTEPQDPEIARVRTEFEYGNYANALKQASERIDRGNLSQADVIELHKYAGLAGFYLHQKPAAERHLWALLQLDPDYRLDPFLVPPQAMTYFEELRKERASELEAIREERRRRAERLKETEERERARLESEQQRRRLEELARQASISPARPQPFIVNLLPFGAGQFQQGRTGAGIAFAATEGVLALTSVAAFLAYNSLIQDRSVTLDQRLTPNGTYTMTVRGIPPEREHQANVWRAVKYSSGGAFWLTYVIGVVDAILHHRSATASPASTAQSVPQDAAGPAEKQPERRSNRVDQSPTSETPRALGLTF